jgi:hypothetical protein
LHDFFGAPQFCLLCLTRPHLDLFPHPLRLWYPTSASVYFIRSKGLFDCMEAGPSFLLIRILFTLIMNKDRFLLVSELLSTISAPNDTHHAVSPNSSSLLRLKGGERILRARNKVNRENLRLNEFFFLGWSLTESRTGRRAKMTQGCKRIWLIFSSQCTDNRLKRVSVNHERNVCETGEAHTFWEPLFW